MDNQKIGSFICSLRKAKGLTQKELAEKLNVTDKAVSKWERGMGYPEITTMPILAEALGVSTSELMLGEKSQPDSGSVPDTEVLVTGAMEFVEQAHRQRAHLLKDVIFYSINAAYLIAVFVCVLCNYVIGTQLSWSLYVVGSVAAAFLITTPLFLLKKHRVAGAMAGLTVAVLPLLFLIEYLCPVKGWVIPFALPMTLMSLCGLWVAVLLFSFTKINRLYLASFCFLLFGVVLNLLISSFVCNYLKSGDSLSNIIVSLSCGLIAIVLFTFAVLKKRK